MAGILDGQSKLFSSDGGDVPPIIRHPSFRVFAAMNPPTDVGKKELPISLRFELLFNHNTGRFLVFRLFFYCLIGAALQKFILKNWLMSKICVQLCNGNYIPIEYFSDQIDLISFIDIRYLRDITDAPIDDIVSVYLGCRATSELGDQGLVDGAGQRPRYSLRSLTRSLRATLKFLQLGIRPLNR